MTEQTVEDPNAKHTVERRRVEWKFSEGDRANTFCKIMRHPDAPESFNFQVLKQLKGWRLVDPLSNPDLRNYEEFRKVVWGAETEAEKESPPFVEAFNANPWDFNWCVEGEYLEDELPDRFPTALKIRVALPDNVRFSFRAEPAQFYLRLVTREDGRRQVIRPVDTTRKIDDINEDAKKAPSIVPPFEAVKLEDGRTVLLIQWMEGHMPKTDEERALCLTHAEELLSIPVDSYGLWAGNFLVSDQLDEVTKQPKIFYIDRVIPETIAGKGYSQEIPEERRRTFEAGKEKMK